MALNPLLDLYDIAVGTSKKLIDQAFSRSDSKFAAALDHEYWKKRFDAQNQRQDELIKDQRHYESPVEQRRRMSAAGFNMTQGGQTTLDGQMSAAEPSSGSGPSVGMLPQSSLDKTIQGVNLQRQIAETENIEADTALKNKEAGLTEQKIETEKTIQDLNTATAALRSTNQLLAETLNNIRALDLKGLKAKYDGVEGWKLRGIGLSLDNIGKALSNSLKKKEDFAYLPTALAGIRLAYANFYKAYGEIGLNKALTQYYWSNKESIDHGNEQLRRYLYGTVSVEDADGNKFSASPYQLEQYSNVIQYLYTKQKSDDYRNSIMRSLFLQIGGMVFNTAGQIGAASLHGRNFNFQSSVVPANQPVFQTPISIPPSGQLRTPPGLIIP